MFNYFHCGAIERTCRFKLLEYPLEYCIFLSSQVQFVYSKKLIIAIFLLRVSLYVVWHFLWNKHVLNEMLGYAVALVGCVNSFLSLSARNRYFRRILCYIYLCYIIKDLPSCLAKRCLSLVCLETYLPPSFSQSTLEFVLQSGQRDETLEENEKKTKSKKKGLILCTFLT